MEIWGQAPVAGGHVGLGARSPAAGRFFVTFWEKKLFKCHRITFRTGS